MLGSKRHNELTNRTRGWFRSRATHRGIRWGSEIYLTSEYVADAIALGSFQWRYMTDYCKNSGKIIRTNLTEFHKEDFEKDLVDGYWLCVFESKISRSDFLQTFKKNAGNRLIPKANMHWLVTPKTLIKVDELPKFWGLLEMSGRGLCEVRKPQICDISDEYRNEIAHNMLWK